jgi:cytochrome c peroxidase
MSIVRTRRLLAYGAPIAAIVASAALVIGAAGKIGVRGVGSGDDPSTLGLPPLLSPSNNPITPLKVALGRDLFFDKRLSADNSISCASCHDPNEGFADPHTTAIGVRGRTGERNSSTVLNSGYAEPLMWDGKAQTLEEQALLPFLSPDELDLAPEEAAVKLRRQGYSDRFRQAFGEDVSVETMAKALAAYQRTLNAGDAPFDRYLFLGDSTAISPSAKRGFEVFLQKKCDACHLIMTAGLHPFRLKYVLFTDGKFHNLGIGTQSPTPDPGRYQITRDSTDWARFRTPSLRNVALTAPYFHDGSAATLGDVVELYDKGGTPNDNLDAAMTPLNMTADQKADLVRFLESLTSSAAARLSASARTTESPR